MENAMTQSTRFPPITLTAGDREQLERLANASMARFPQIADYLASEVERACVQVGHSANTFVRMGSDVEFRDDATGQVRNVTLVFPGDADVTLGNISVLTPVGAALIGLSTNQSIEWHTPSGERRSLTVLSIGKPPVGKSPTAFD
jgi:regulator of nucleoside diphosphate kinase